MPNNFTFVNNLLEIDEQYERGFVWMGSAYLAMGHAALGDMDRAFESLERAYQARSAGLIYLHLDPGYDPLRGDPRYTEMVNRIGLR